MTRIQLIERESTNAIIGAFFDVYNELGFGFLEKVYKLALERELIARGRTVGREVSVPIYYKGEILTRHRTDLMVDKRVVVEVKSTYVLPPMTRRQTLDYLSATRIQVALILHFGPEAKFYRLVNSGRSRIREDSL